MTCRVGSRVLLFTIWFLGVAAAVTITGTRAQEMRDELSSRAREVLKRRCFQCHGQNGIARNNVFVLDHARLLSSKTITPGDTSSLPLKVTAFDGNFASPKIAKELLKRLGRRSVQKD